MNTESGNEVVIDSDEYIAAVKLNSQWRFYHDILSMWILDYAAYNPYHDPDLTGWRTGLLQVNETNAREYCEALTDCEIHPQDIPRVRQESFDSSPPKLTFVVNFDEKLFVNGWQDNIAIHEYAPLGWTALEDDPYDYIPEELRLLWGR